MWSALASQVDKHNNNTPTPPLCRVSPNQTRVIDSPLFMMAGRRGVTSGWVGGTLDSAWKGPLCRRVSRGLSRGGGGRVGLICVGSALVDAQMGPQ